MAVYGLSTYFVSHLTRDEALAKIVGAGFCQVELAGEEDHLDSWPADPSRMRRVLEGMGLRAASVHTPQAGWDVTAPDDAARTAAIQAATACFGQAAEVSAEMVVCHPNGPSVPYTVETYEANWARSRESLAILAESARVAGVKMAVENLPASGRPRPGATMGQVLGMIEGLGEHVGICLDVGHSNANGRDPAAEALEAGEKLFTLHIHDNDGRGEDQHLIPGRGTTDWDAFLAALEAMAFEGIRTLEVGRPEGFETTLAALAAIRREWEAR